MYDGWLACPAAAESQLAMGENGGEGVGAHDRRWRAAAGFRLNTPNIRRGEYEGLAAADVEL